MEPKIIGPALPPHLIKGNNCEYNDSKGEGNDSKDEADVSCKVDSDMYGPALPPRLKIPPSTLGPSLPPGYLHQSETGMTLHNYDGSDSDEDTIVGPVPESDKKEGKISLGHHQLELRAHYLKRKLAEEGCTNEEKVKRESWMLELPPEKAKNLGLGPRTFRMKEGPDMSNRSDWTDTPADKARKQLLGEDCGLSKKSDMKAAAVSERDKAMEILADKCKKDKKRQMSLLEMHTKKKLKKEKKEKKEKGGKVERRPFDRNVDLQTNRFDEAQKKAIFKKAQLLDTRFSQGQSKYL